ncbi:hypothetical protein BC629DRAFT_1441319 [Irpex lacteus]|nr:hypothetical protein BC629DRAFT_1441319 [Irpex lacteus]
MKSFAALALLAGSALAQQFTINTPNGVVQCVTTQFTFSGGTGPYFLSINTPDANGTPQQTYDGITSSPFTWSANITANTQLGLSLTDRSNGNKALSGTFTIGASGDSSCLVGGVGSTATTSGSESATSGAASSPASESSAAATSATSAATGATSSVAATGASTSAPAGTSAHSTGSSAASHSGSASASASPTGANSGAFANSVSAGVVGVVGAVAALVMA